MQQNALKEQLEKEVLKSVSDIKKAFHYVYFEERKDLVKAIYLLLDA